MKNLLPFLLFFCLLAGCQKPESDFSPTPRATSTVKECCEHELGVAETSEMSLYNLDSKWTSHRGQEFSLSQLQGEPVLLAMIYSSCKAACPVILEDMRKIESEIEALHPDRIKYVLVSIDPEVDTPERLQRYAKESKLGSQWTFLNGSSDQVLELAALVGVKYRKTSETDYAHSNVISILDRKGEVVSQQEGLGVDPQESLNVLKELLKE